MQIVLKKQKSEITGFNFLASHGGFFDVNLFQYSPRKNKISRPFLWLIKLQQ